VPHSGKRLAAETQHFAQAPRVDAKGANLLLGCSVHKKEITLVLATTAKGGASTIPPPTKKPQLSPGPNL
jgi:hypothetical protein